MTGIYGISSNSDNELLRWLAAFVKHHRLQKNLSQAKLAERAGINRSTLSEFERSGRCNTLTLVQLLRALDQLEALSYFKIAPPEPTPSMLAEAQAKYNSRQRASRQNPTDPPYESSW